jgi:hypothetical protein
VPHHCRDGPDERKWHHAERFSDITLGLGDGLGSFDAFVPLAAPRLSSPVTATPSAGIDVPTTLIVADTAPLSRYGPTNWYVCARKPISDPDHRFQIARGMLDGDRSACRQCV